MSLIKKAHDLVGVGLENFAVKLMTEVCIVDEESNIKGCSVGFLESEELAKGFVDCQTDPKRYRTRECSVLMDGNVGFLLNVEPVFLINADDAKRMVKEKALTKLTPFEQKLMREQ